MCLYPNLIQNPKYKKNKKNGGNVPVCVDQRLLYVPVGCGKCIECTKKKQRDWTVRLNEENKSSKKKAYFITLTFSSENYISLLKETKKEGYEGDNATATLAVRRFLERWRKKYKKSIRHWLVTELGGGRYEHLHIHGIIWTDKEIKELEKKWQYGYVYIGDYCNEKTINYIVKYIHKPDQKHKAYKPIILTSAGIGKGYWNSFNAKQKKYKEKETDESYTTPKGFKMGLPIYYRNYIYTEQEREKLWLEKLDKNERWVVGEKINLKNAQGEEDYKKLREYYRKKSARLGYGAPLEWKDWHYENEKRKMLQKQRGEEINNPLTLNTDIKNIWDIMDSNGMIKE